MNVFDYIQNNLNSRPDHVAIYENGTGITYAQLHNKVIDAANSLLDQGVQKHQGVAVLGSNSSEFIVMAFAVMKIEAVVLPLPEHMSSAEIEDFIRISRLHFICFNKKYNEYHGVVFDSPGLSTSWYLWKNNESDSDKKYASHIGHPALVRFTSGTTGKSKGVILSHQTIHDRIEAANSSLKLNSSDKVLWVLSMAFHFVVSIILYLKNGCTIVLSNNFLAKSILEDIKNHSASFLYASPMHIRLLTAHNSGLLVPSLAKVISTSTAISKEQCDLFYNKFHIPVSQAYGIIEIGLPVINSFKVVEYPDAIGYAVEGYDVSILDDNGNKLKDGQTGNLAIKGPGMFDGYLSPPCASDEILQFGYFITGDIAKKLPGGLIKVEGRRKSMINVGGNKVFPEEVEGVLMQMPEIENCRVSGYSHKLVGECVMAEICLNKSVPDVETEKIYQYCKKHLSSYKVPQKIKIVDELPMTKSGKVKR